MGEAMYKYFYKCELSVVNDTEVLKKKFNTATKKYFFKNGQYKGDSGVFVLNDLTTRVYSDPRPSKQYKDCVFFPPENDIRLDDFEIHPDKKEWKIPVDTVTGVKLWIIPATLEPKKIVFDFDETPTQEEESPFSLATDYGCLAYAIFDDIRSKKPVHLDDVRVKKLIMMALQKSYNLPIDVFNWAGVVSAQDLDPLLSAALGINTELLAKKEDGCEA